MKKNWGLFQFKSFQNIILPLVLLLLNVVTYGLLIRWLGFYWDDWYYVWISHSLGGQGLLTAQAMDRPASGYIFMLVFKLLGYSPLAWHIFNIFVRWLCSLAAWWTLKGLWPKQRWENITVSILFTVYPGYTQQPIPIPYSYIIILLFLTWLSFGSMLQANRVSRHFCLFTILALFCQSIELVCIEYYIGLELLRPLFIWFTIKEEDKRKRFSYTLKRWMPYLAVMGIYLIWRLFFFNSIRSATNQGAILKQILASPILELGKRSLHFFT
ncbi:MAG TPA: hypothetical protein VMT91_07380, partial [Anaerolineales bacterium]|nr:hypothetical protein [Anaerolineales bacterium]